MDLKTMQRHKMQLDKLILVFLLLAGMAGAAIPPMSELIAAPALRIICGVFNGLKLAGGAVASLVLVYSGFKWVGESDDPGARKNARDHMKWALVGILIIIMSEMIVIYVANDVAIQGCTFWCTWVTC